MQVLKTAFSFLLEINNWAKSIMFLLYPEYWLQ